MRLFVNLKLTVLLIVLFYTISPAHAAIPQIPTIYQTTSAVLNVPGSATGLYYAMTPAGSGTQTVDANGTVYRKSEVAWVDLGPDGKTPTLQQENITTQINYLIIAGIAGANPSTYPLLYGATHAPIYPPPVDPNHIPAVNDNFTQGGIACKVSNVLYYNYVSMGGINSSTKLVPNGPCFFIDYWGLISGITYSGYYYVAGASYVPPIGVNSASVFVTYVAGSSSGGSALSTYQAELDKMFQDPAYTPYFTDDSTGLAYIPPASVPPQDQLCTADGGAYNVSVCKYQKDAGPVCNSIPTASTVNLKSGNYLHSQNIITKPGSLSFDLSYNSLENLDIPLGKGWTHTYNISLKEAYSTITLKLGNGDFINFPLSGTIYLPASTSNDTSSIVKNSDGTYTRTFKSGLTQTFNSTGQLTTITDPNGNITTLSYSGTDLATITDQTGRTLTITSSGGRISGISDPAGNTTSFAYTGNLLSSVTDPAGNSWHYAYDASGKMNQKTDPAGNQSSNVYDAAGKNSSSTDPEGRTKTISYNSTNNTSTITEKDGGIWTRTYDFTLNAPTASTDPLGNTTRYTYDGNGNMLTSTDPLGNTTSYTYDADYNLLTETDPLGKVTSYTYNSLGQVLTKTDPAGNITSSYDAKGNLLQRIDPTGAKTVFTYDTTGKLLTVTDPRNNVTSYAYDTYNNLASVTLPTTAVTSFTYDANGNVLTVTNAANKVTTYTYDVMNRLASVTDPLGNVTTYAYDKLGNRTSQTDANGAVTTYTYNYHRQMIESKDVLGNFTTYSYGATGCPSCGGGADKLTSLTDAKGQATLWQYDLLGRPTRETDPLGKATIYAYDAAGNLQTRTDANNATISYFHDKLKRLTGKIYPDATTESYIYDTAGRIQTAANKDISYSYTYDVDNRVTSVSDNRGYTITYLYDQVGNRTTMTFQPGTQNENVTTYSYDNGNRLQTITSPAGLFSYGYDLLNRKISLAYPNQVVASYTYDDAGRLTGIGYNGNLPIYTVTYPTFDKVGNRMAKNDGTAVTYIYDLVYRLLNSSAGETFTYDNVGNRLSDASRLYAYNAGNQLVSAGTANFGYDANGNTTTRNQWRYTWDAAGRMTSATDGSTLVSFTYDPFGRRIGKTVNGVTTSYVYDNANIIASMTNGEVSTFVHGLGTDEHLAMVQAGQPYFYHTDGLGSITRITDSVQAVVATYSYDSFGNSTVTDTLCLDQPFTYTGREWDKETGLYYYRARYYDANVGRFIQKDPIGFKGGINVYAYVQNNPVNFIDPDGLEYRVIGTRMGVPMVLDTNTGQVTVGFPNNYVDPITSAVKDAPRAAGQCYLKTMDTIADATNTLPDALQPKGKPYPGFLGEMWRVLLPFRNFLRLP